IPDLRKNVFGNKVINSDVWIMTVSGSSSMADFLRGNSNLRFSPATILATTACLGWELSYVFALDYAANTELIQSDSMVSPADLSCGNKGLNAQVREQVGKKLATVFADVLTPGSNEEQFGNEDSRPISAGGHGALFHLVQIANYQLQHRYGGGAPIKGVEKSRYVALFGDQADVPDATETLICGKSKRCYLKKLRYVDIVLGEDGLDKPEHWIELKSYAAQSSGTDAKRYLF